MCLTADRNLHHHAIVATFILTGRCPASNTGGEGLADTAAVEAAPGNRLGREVPDLGTGLPARSPGIRDMRHGQRRRLNHLQKIWRLVPSFGQSMFNLHGFKQSDVGSVLEFRVHSQPKVDLGSGGPAAGRVAAGPEAARTDWGVGLVLDLHEILSSTKLQLSKDSLQKPMLPS